MTTAIILAGGSGTRLGAPIPKQFIEVAGKPILVHTLERFEEHPQIDAIVVVCVSEWESTIRNYIQQYGFTKIKKIVTGGPSAILSIKNGFLSIEGKPDDIVLVHEGVRPLVEEKMITDILEKCKEFGAAMSATPLKEHIFFQKEGDLVSGYFPRERAYKSSSPHAYTLQVLSDAFKKAESLGESYNTAFSSTMMIDVGIPVAISYGSELNIKITTKEDIALFKALFETINEEN